MNGLTMEIRDFPRRVFGSATGNLVDPAEAAHQATLVPETGAGASPYLAVLELSGRMLSPASLREMIVPFGQRMRGGAFGDIKVVVVAQDDAVREQVALLAREYAIPLYVAESVSQEDIESAVPAGSLTPSETQTINVLRGLGGSATVANFAAATNLEPSAASNRLVSAETKGYLYRLSRGRRVGDLFVDPRTRQEALVESFRNPGAPNMRDALIQHGIHSNPYDDSPVEMDEAAVKRANELFLRTKDT